MVDHRSSGVFSVGEHGRPGDTSGVDIAELTRKILDRRDDPSRPLRIVQAGHPALRRPALAARGRLGEDLLDELVDAMTVTMRKAPGVGLAAPQIGLPLALFVVEDRSAPSAAGRGLDEADAPAGAGAGTDALDASAALERVPVPLRAILDPSVERLGTQRVYAWEGCLSVDGWQSIIPRSRRVRLQATELGAGGEMHEIDEQFTGWPARIMQHETDHLRGVLCHDAMVPRSFVAADYTSHYEQMPEAVRRLGLTGEITELAPGEVVLG